LLGENFTLLRDFAGGLASAFPSTATIKSDFCLLKWEKNDCSGALTDFPLEGILHCKPWEAPLKHKTEWFGTL
jgi:hypothetical protein